MVASASPARSPHENPQAADDRPAVVSLGLSAPGLDGRDTLRASKSDERLPTLPVVVHTTSNRPGDLDLCDAAGANADQVKPVSGPQRLEALWRVFGDGLDEVERPGTVGAGCHRV